MYGKGTSNAILGTKVLFEAVLTQKTSKLLWHSFFNERKLYLERLTTACLISHYIGSIYELNL